MMRSCLYMSMLGMGTMGHAQLQRHDDMSLPCRLRNIDMALQQAMIQGFDKHSLNAWLEHDTNAHDMACVIAVNKSRCGGTQLHAQCQSPCLHHMHKACFLLSSSSTTLHCHARSYLFHDVNDVAVPDGSQVASAHLMWDNAHLQTHMRCNFVYLAHLFCKQLICKRSWQQPWLTSGAVVKTL